MTKIQIKSRWTGSVLFELEKEYNTIKDTLTEAVKSGANLSGANLSGANLSGANLRGAGLRDANLRGADLSGADLRCADLCDADLSGADLCGAALRGADLSGADLCDAGLYDADLSGADLRGAKEIPYIPLTCPSYGAFIGWKKVKGCLVQLLIPEDAKRCSATSQKCRCEFAKVVSITRIENGEELQSIENTCYTPSVVYKVGEIVKPDSFDENRWNECSHGIHFFINKQAAINY